MTAPANCDRCPALVKCRKTIVNGWGNPNARFAFVGLIVSHIRRILVEDHDEPEDAKETTDALPTGASLCWG